MIRVKLILLTLIVFSCSKPKEMDEWETQMAKKIEAEEVQLSYKQISRNVDGYSESNQSFLVLDILNSKLLEEMDYDKRLKKSRCDEIKNLVLSVPELSIFPTYNQLRISIANTHGFWIFKSTQHDTIFYRTK
jgi:hypothetical protein